MRTVTLSDYFNPVGIPMNAGQIYTSLYVIKFPITPDHQTSPIKSVTLPDLDTAHSTPPCGQPASQALHIFAMTIQ